MEKVRVSSTMHGTGANGEVTISKLSKDEVKRIEGLVHGQNWMSVEKGRPVFRDKFVNLPDPIEDTEMLPFWRKATEYEITSSPLHQEEMFSKEMYENSFSRSITIQHLCGHYYTPHDYKIQAKKLTSYGFQEMRSKRGLDGDFWSMWYLPGLWSAEGELREVVEKVEAKYKSWEDPLSNRKKNECFDTAIEFLRKNVVFGTLDVSVQRLAMPAPD